MGSIWKAISSVIFMLLLAFVAIATIGGDNDTKAADAYLQRCATELQVCNFNDEVIQQFQTEAAENGYTLKVDKMTDSYGDVLYATIELTYTYKIPLIQLESEHTKTLISK